MRIEKKTLNDALRVLGKVVSQTSPVELHRSVRSSVEAELHGKSPLQSGNNPPVNTPNQPVQGSTPASPKQINYLLTLASRRGITPQQIAIQNNVADINQLSKKQCSTLIKQWKAA